MQGCLIFLVSLASLLFDSDEIDISFVGDAMQHQSQLDAALASGGSTTYDYSSYFKEIEPIVKAADYAVVNLECPLGGKGYTGYPQFCAPDSYAKALQDAGFDLALTANNHILDRREAGLKRTLAVLDEMNFPHVGCYANASERDSLAQFITNINGFNVAFLNYTYSTNGIPCPPTVAVDYLNLNKMKNDIDNVRKKGAEIVIVCPHWGLEYKLLPEQAERKMAHALIEHGADIVMGGHPHVIQPMELRRDSTRNSLIVYSLGNFISGMKTDDTRGGAMCTVKLKRDSLGKPYVADANYRLLYTQKPCAETKNFRLIPAELPIEDQTTKTQRAVFVRNAEAIFNKHNINVSRDTAPADSFVRRSLIKKIPTIISTVND
ncbi:MAG: CapA family protein [Paramuribaculum sp.]|nr:CapA family protein [Paramuribaculum sp.]